MLQSDMSSMKCQKTMGAGYYDYPKTTAYLTLYNMSGAQKEILRWWDRELQFDQDDIAPLIVSVDTDTESEESDPGSN